MEESKEITALFHLIDDPDEEVFDAVSKKIVDYGKPIIPNLEHLWETTPSEETQARIELLIHRLHFRDLMTLCWAPCLFANSYIPSFRLHPYCRKLKKFVATSGWS